MTNADVVLGLIQRVTKVKIVNAVKEMKLGKATGPSEMNIEMIVARDKTGAEVLVKLYQRVVYGKGIPDEWKTSVVVPIIKEKEML